MGKPKPVISIPVTLEEKLLVEKAVRLAKGQSNATWCRKWVLKAAREVVDAPVVNLGNNQFGQQEKANQPVSNGPITNTQQLKEAWKGFPPSETGPIAQPPKLAPEPPPGTLPETVPASIGLAGKSTEMIVRPTPQPKPQPQQPQSLQKRVYDSIAARHGVAAAEEWKKAQPH